MASLEFFLAMVPPTVTDQQKGVTIRGGKHLLEMTGGNK